MALFILAIFFGCSLAAFGGIGFAERNQEPTCDGKVMHPGDHCVNVKTGTRTSYGQMRSGDKAFPLVMLAIGGVLIVGGTAGLLAQRSLNRRYAPARRMPPGGMPGGHYQPAPPTYHGPGRG